jgi:hypothetical protein
MEVRVCRESKLLLDFIVGPTLDVARTNSYFQLETKKNPDFPAQRVVRLRRGSRLTSTLHSRRSRLIRSPVRSRSHSPRSLAR